MKYIIEIENEPFGRNDDPFFPHGMDELYRAKGFKSLVFDKNGLDKLTPYTEPDRKAVDLQYAHDIENVARMNYNEGAKDAWEFCMNTDWSWISEIDTKPLREYSYQEAKAKYEAWRKQKDEIRVGDEVVYADDPNKEKAIVLRLYQPKQYKTLADILCEDGTVVKMIKVENLAWTGRHFDEVEDMLKKMKGA